jgi:hypothetical protein
MAYRKILVDNLICKRRFHLTYDDAAAPQATAEVRCLHCQAPIYMRKNHPPLQLAREENLVSTTDLSPLQSSHCNFNQPREHRTEQ